MYILYQVTQQSQLNAISNPLLIFTVAPSLPSHYHSRYRRHSERETEMEEVGRGEETGERYQK